MKSRSGTRKEIATILPLRGHAVVNTPEFEQMESRLPNKKPYPADDEFQLRRVDATDLAESCLSRCLFSG